MSDKEALERLKVDEIANEAVHQWNAAGNPHLSTGAIGVARIAAEIARAGSIAEREGLETKSAEAYERGRKEALLEIAHRACEVPELERVRLLFAAEARAEAAKSKLSALSEAAGKVVDACDCGLLGQWDLDSLRALLACPNKFADSTGYNPADDGASKAPEPMTGESPVGSGAIIRRALLHPTVPVERDLGSVGSGLTPLVPSPSAANEPATPSSDDWICVGCGAEAPRKRRPCNCASGLVMTRNKDRVECAAGVFLSECSGWSRVRDALLVAYARFRDLADDIRLDPGVRNHANRAMELMDKALEG